MEKPKLTGIAIIGEFDDGKCRQIVIKEETEKHVIKTIVSQEKEIHILESPLEGIEPIRNNNS